MQIFLQNYRLLIRVQCKPHVTNANFSEITGSALRQNLTVCSTPCNECILKLKPQWGFNCCSWKQEAVGNHYNNINKTMHSNTIYLPRPSNIHKQAKCCATFVQPKHLLPPMPAFYSIATESSGIHNHLEWIMLISKLISQLHQYLTNPTMDW